MTTTTDLRHIKGYMPFFPGFYDTVFDVSDFDYQELVEEKTFGMSKDLIEYIQVDLGITNYDWLIKDSYYVNVARDFVENMGFEISSKFKRDNINLSFEYVDIWSPKYYNYENDKIVVDVIIDNDSILRIVNLLENKYFDEFDEYLKSNYSSRDGFISFVSDNPNDWINYLLTLETECLEYKLTSVIRFLYLQYFKENNKFWKEVFLSLIVDIVPLHEHIDICLMDDDIEKLNNHFNKEYYKNNDCDYTEDIESLRNN